jgi:hypothetical protein
MEHLVVAVQEAALTAKTGIVRTAVNISPSSSWPFWQHLEQWIGEIMFGAEALCVLVLIISALVFAFGKINTNGAARAVGITGMIVAVFAGILIASGPAIINWATGQSIA